MDPITELRLAAQRRATFERRAAEQRRARSLRPRRTVHLPSLRLRTGSTPAPLTCCPA